MFTKIRKNEEKQKLLFELFHKRVYATAYFITKDPHLSQDILQETFIKAFRHLDQLADLEKAGAWLAKIASRTAIDFIRKQKRWNETSLENVLYENTKGANEITSSVEKEIEGKWVKENLQNLIDQLSPNYRAVIILKYIHEFKDEEIADVLDERVGTIKSRIHRAKNKLNTMIQTSSKYDGDIL